MPVLADGAAQIRQRLQEQHVRSTLGRAAVTHAGAADLSLDQPERMLDTAPHAGLEAPAVLGLLALAMAPRPMSRRTAV